MKIIYVGAFRFPYFDAAAARVLNIGKSFRAAGYDVEYIAMGGCQVESHRQKDGNFRYQDFLYTVTNELDCNGGLLDKIMMKITRGNKVLNSLENRELKDSLVIAYNPQERFLKKLISLSNKKGFKLAVDLTEWYDRNELPITDWLSYYKCMTRVMNQVKNKIVISSYLNDYYIKSNNIVIPATCDMSDEKWRRCTNNINSFDGVTLIYAGNPAKKDLVHTVINAVNRLSAKSVAIRFLILGIIKEDYLRKYSDKLNSNELTNNIVFLGKVSQNEVPAYYKHADYMVLLRDNNRKSNAGFPTKIAEALTAGVPVIANATSDIGKYIKNSVNGYILEDVRSEYVESALNKICTSYSKQNISEQKNNALKTGREAFDYTNYTDGLIRFIQNLS